MTDISIVTASYNYENYIKETIESVQNQTYKDWEMIVVDDGSKDNSVEVIKSYCNQDKRIKLFQHENGQNKGLAETVKFGIEQAQGKWIIFLESDDTITPDYIEKKLKIIEKYPNVDVVFNGINMFGEKETIEEQIPYFEKQKKILDKITFPSSLKKAYQKTYINLIPTFSCVMAKKDVFKNIDYDSPIKKCLDLYIWLQLARDCIMYYTDEKLTNWRMHKTSYINSKTASPEEYFAFNYKRIVFLHTKWAVFKIFYHYFNAYRKQLIQIHLTKGRREIVLFGKKFDFKNKE